MKLRMVTSYLSLGSNMGDRLKYLTQAVKKLNEHPDVKITKLSAVYETAAWGLESQDDFYNSAIGIKTSLSPHELLDICQNIERKLQRTRQIHWGPRTIDIDILLYGTVDIQEDQLIVPHPYMLERAFVMIPLYEIAPHLAINGVEIAELVKKFDEQATCSKTEHQI